MKMYSHLQLITALSLLFSFSLFCTPIRDDFQKGDSSEETNIVCKPIFLPFSQGEIVTPEQSAAARTHARLLELHTLLTHRQSTSPGNLSKEEVILLDSISAKLPLMDQSKLHDLQQRINKIIDNFPS